MKAYVLSIKHVYDDGHPEDRQKSCRVCGVYPTALAAKQAAKELIDRKPYDPNKLEEFPDGYCYDYDQSEEVDNYTIYFYEEFDLSVPEE